MQTNTVTPFYTLAQLIKDKEVIPLWDTYFSTHDTLSPICTERSTLPAQPDRALSGISSPELVVFEPKQHRSNNNHQTGILVIPGGSYQRIAIDREGIEIAHVLNQWGYTVFVMSYRMPGDGHALGPDVSFVDAQRAMRVIQSNKQWDHLLHLGVLGFSAGGHVAARLATQFAQQMYPATDSADHLNIRLDFAALLYPVISMDEAIVHRGSQQELFGNTATKAQSDAYSMEKKVSSQTPPCFITHAVDDRSVVVDHSLAFFQALRAHSIPVEMHLFQSGGHGFGHKSDQRSPAYMWPKLLHRWIQDLFVGTGT